MILESFVALNNNIFRYLCNKTQIQIQLDQTWYPHRKTLWIINVPEYSQLERKVNLTD